MLPTFLLVFKCVDFATSLLCEIAEARGLRNGPTEPLKRLNQSSRFVFHKYFCPDPSIIRNKRSHKQCLGAWPASEASSALSSHL